MTLMSNCGKSYYLRYLKKKISIPAETRNESFLTSCSTSKNDVLTYIFNNLTSKSGRDVTLSHLFLRGEVKIYLDEPPPSAWRCQSTFQSVAGPAPYRVRGWRVRALSLFLYGIIQRTVAGEFPKPQRSITFQSVAGFAPYRVRGNEARYFLTQAK